MARKLNCWEFMNCGREAGGLMADILGVCPVSQAMKLDGRNGGTAAGRACWLLKSSGCNSIPSECGQLSDQCKSCRFYRRVQFEQHGNGQPNSPAEPRIPCPTT